MGVGIEGELSFVEAMHVQPYGRAVLNNEHGGAGSGDGGRK